MMHDNCNERARRFFAFSGPRLEVSNLAWINSSARAKFEIALTRDWNEKGEALSAVSEAQKSARVLDIPPEACHFYFIAVLYLHCCSIPRLFNLLPFVAAARAAN